MNIFSKKKFPLNKKDFFTDDFSPRLFNPEETQEKLITGIRILIKDIFEIAQKEAINPLSKLSYKETKTAPYLYFQIIDSSIKAMTQLNDLVDEANKDTFRYQIQIENYINKTKQLIIDEIIEPLNRYEKEEKANSNFIQNFKLAIKEFLDKFINLFAEKSEISHFAFFKPLPIISHTQKILSKEIDIFENLRINN